VSVHRNLRVPGSRSKMFAKGAYLKCSPRVHIGTRFFCHGVERGLVAGKNRLERSVIWSAFFTDLDFADDVALLAELLELLVPALETMASEAASLGLEIGRRQKSKLWAAERTYHQQSQF